MKKVAICQSNYIPWTGYFDLITSVDQFVPRSPHEIGEHLFFDRNTPPIVYANS